jgi:hypothetical protein
MFADEWGIDAIYSGSQKVGGKAGTLNKRHLQHAGAFLSMLVRWLGHTMMITLLVTARQQTR